jgi:hypothetical protein
MQHSGQEKKNTERDKRVLSSIVSEKCKQSSSQIMSEINSHLQNPNSTKSVQKELQSNGVKHTKTGYLV